MVTVEQPPYTIRPIHTEQDYEEALAVIETLIDAQPGSTDMDQLELLSILVHDYEQREFPIENPDPIDAIVYQMEQLAISRQELAEWVGGKARLSELLNRKRPLSLKQIQTLAEKLEIPADILLQTERKTEPLRA